jgi:hypothetical protein
VQGNLFVDALAGVEQDKNRGVVRVEEAIECGFVRPEIRERHVVEGARRAGVQEHNLSLEREWLALRLFQQLGQLVAALQLRSRSRAKLTAELREGSTRGTSAHL